MKSNYTNMLKQVFQFYLAINMINVVIHSTIQVVIADLYKHPLNQKAPNDVGLNFLQKREVTYAHQDMVDNLAGMPGQGYYIEVAIGTPPQKLNILIDTGSSNFAVACEPDENIATYFQRKSSSTYTNQGRHVNVPYTQGMWDGELGSDFVSIPSLSNSTDRVNIACITTTQDFYINGSHWQGILGMGYAAIARPDSSVEPFFDSLVRAGRVENVFSIQLCGAASQSPNPDVVTSGSMVFGGAPSVGELYATPINKEWYYEVIIVDVEVAGISLAMDCKEYNFGKTIVDTGTTNLRLPAKVFNAVIAKLTDAVQPSTFNPPSPKFWSGEDLLCWPKGEIPYNSFPTITIVLPYNDTSAFKLVISPQQYLRIIGPNEDVEKSRGDDCYKLAIASSNSGAVIGAVILEGFYVVFDREHKQLQFGVSPCNVIDSQAVRSTIVASSVVNGNYKDCAYVKVDSHSGALAIVGYVMAAICVVCLVPLIFLIIQWQCRRCRGGRRRLRRTNSDSNDLVEEQK